MNSNRSHERYLWDGREQGYALGLDPTGDLSKSICVFAPDTVHPENGTEWWQDLDSNKRDKAVREAESRIGAAYGYVKSSDFTLAEAIRYADTAFRYRCFAFCDSLESVCSVFDYWISLGANPIGQSDSDSFLLADSVVLTYTPDYSDIRCQTGCYG